MSRTTRDCQIHTQQDNGLPGQILQTAVHEKAGIRWLSFGDGGEQSAIDLNNAYRLVAPVSQSLLTGLIFTPTPQQALLLGTGGGAIARFFAHREPACCGDAIEHSAVVAHIARQLFDFPDAQSGWSLQLGDACEYIVAAEKQYDFIALDIAEESRTPTGF